VFGDQLKKIINQIHEISPFSNNAADDNDGSLKYSPSSGTGPLVSNAIFKETISIFQSHQSENVTETIDNEETKHRKHRDEFSVRPKGETLRSKNKDTVRVVEDYELFDTAKIASR